MKILFYSTNSNHFDRETYKINVLPTNESFFQEFIKNHPQHEFICISQEPATFMPEKSTILLQNNLTALEFAQKIIDFKPDLAMSMTYWVTPYDWLPINDALVAEELERNGIKTICHSLQTTLTSFDKWKTYQKLQEAGFPQAKSIFVDHDLYFCAGSHKEVVNNVYKASLRSQLENLKLPLIIKDTCGLSSYGMTVVHTYGEAICYLNSKRNNSNRLVQEYLDGDQLGLEIYGRPGNYKILPPLRFSLNQYGITSPKQSAKCGPELLTEELKSQMLRLADLLELKGAAQVDFIYKDKKYYIIEINPRLSGMTFAYCQSLGLSVFELLYRTCIFDDDLPAGKDFSDDAISPAPDFLPPMKNVMSLKLPIIPLSKMSQILKIKGVQLLNQTNDLAAKQEREKGFCECIICGDDKTTIENAVLELEKIFPGEATIQQSETILK